MELDYKWFSNRLVALEKDINEYRSECATLAPIMWQYQYLRCRMLSIRHAIDAFKQLQFRFEMHRSPAVEKRVQRILNFNAKSELVFACNKYREVQAQLFADRDLLKNDDLPF